MCWTGGASLNVASPTLQQRLRLLQIARVEPLRKPPVNRSKQFACLLHLALIAPGAAVLIEACCPQAPATKFQYRWKLRRHLSELLTAFGYRGPGLRTVAIHMHFRVQPARVVESTGFDEPKIRHNSNIRDNG